MRKLLGVFILCIPFIPYALAQDAQANSQPSPISDSDIQLLRSDVQAGKNQIITDTMAFNDQQSTAFWPIYRDYARDQQVIGDDRVKLIKDYAAHYDSMDDATAQDLAQRMFDIDARTLKLRKDYWPKFEKALGAKQAAKFYQVDNRLTLIINLQLTDVIPLIQ